MKVVKTCSCGKKFPTEDIFERQWITYTAWDLLKNYLVIKLVGFDCDCKSSIAIKPEILGVEQ